MQQKCILDLHRKSCDVQRFFVAVAQAKCTFPNENVLWPRRNAHFQIKVCCGLGYMHISVWHSIVQYNMIQYSIVQCIVVQYSIVQYRGLGGTCITKNNTLSSKTLKRQCKNKKQQKKHREKQKNKKSGASSHLSHSPRGGLEGHA